MVDPGLVVDRGIGVVARVNVARPRRASARTNDVDASKARRRLGWAGQAPGDELLSDGASYLSSGIVADARRRLLQEGNRAS